MIENVVLMDRVISLIRWKATGDAVKFAKKLGMSERSIHRLISEMRDMGFPVKYNSEIQSYIFEESVKYEFIIKVGDHDLLKIKGGRNPRLDLIGF